MSIQIASPILAAVADSAAAQVPIPFQGPAWTFHIAREGSRRLAEARRKRSRTNRVAARAARLVQSELASNAEFLALQKARDQVLSAVAPEGEKEKAAADEAMTATNEAYVVGYRKLLIEVRSRAERELLSEGVITEAEILDAGQSDPIEDAIDVLEVGGGWSGPVDEEGRPEPFSREQARRVFEAEHEFEHDGKTRVFGPWLTDWVLETSRQQELYRGRLLGVVEGNSERSGALASPGPEEQISNGGE